MKTIASCQLILVLCLSFRSVLLFDFASSQEQTDSEPTNFQTKIILGNQYSNKAEIYQLIFICNGSGCQPLQLQASDLLWSSPVTPGISEVKHVIYKGQSAILATTQTGAIIYEYSSGYMLFHKELDSSIYKNVHSAEVLPDGNVVIASSMSDGIIAVLYPDGERVYQDIAQTVKVEIPFGHGVVYDKARGRLYASGYLTFLVLEYHTGNDGRGAFDIVKNISLAYLYDERDKNEGTAFEDGVHDLYPIDGSSDTLFLTTGEHVFTINVEDFTTHSFQNLYTIPSKNSAEKNVEIKNKGGVKVISSDNMHGLVLAKPSPWFKELMSTYDQNYSPYDPILIWTMPNKGSCPSPDYDLTNDCKINFDLLEPIWFYKARIFNRPIFSF